MRRLILLTLFGCLVSPLVHAAPLRVVTWKLQWPASNAAGALPGPGEDSHLRDAAAILNRMDADIIVLQQISDRHACEKLAEYLQPARYFVAVCSAFTNGAGGSAQQLAILSKQSALAAWSENWKSVNAIDSSRGYAFAAVRHGDKVVGIYSAELKDNATTAGSDQETQLNILQRERAAEQILRDVNSIGQRFKRSIDALIVAGNFNTNPDENLFVSEGTLDLFVEAGFTNALWELPPMKRITTAGDARHPAATLDYILGKNVALVSHPTVLYTAVAAHFPVVADLEIKTGPLLLGTTYSGSPMANQHTAWLVAGLFIFLTALYFALWRLARRPAESRWLPIQSPTRPVEYTAHRVHPATAPIPQGKEDLIDAPEGAGAWKPPEKIESTAASIRTRLIPHLARMMMNKLVSTLIFQRRHLIETHQKAASQVSELEERLNKLPRKLQDRIRAYEQRIAELERELNVKDEEYRELIRAQIVVVKKELEEEKSRTRLKWN